MFANSQSGGFDLCALDLCKTPPLGLPVVYANTTSGMQALPNVLTIFYGGGFVHNVNTHIPISSGDELGLMGGVVSGTVKGCSRHQTGSRSVIIQGAGITRMGTLSLANNMNGVGVRIIPSQTKIVILAG